MFVITRENDDVFIASGLLVTYWDNGYPVIKEDSGDECAYVPEEVKLHEVTTIPDYVEKYKYCYTEENGFYENVNYIEVNNSHGISNELYDLIRDEAVEQIESEVAGNADE